MAPSRGCPMPLSSLWGRPVTRAIPLLTDPSLQSVFIIPWPSPLCLCVPDFPLLWFVRTLIGFRTHPKPKTISSQILNKGTYTGSGVRMWTQLFGGTQFNPLRSKLTNLDWGRRGKAFQAEGTVCAEAQLGMAGEGGHSGTGRMRARKLSRCQPVHVLSLNLTVKTMGSH